MPSRCFVYILLHMVVVGTAGAADPITKTSIQFDGVYIGTPFPGDEAYCHYLRFYPKGSVITVSSVCDQSSLADIKKWFNFKKSGPKNSGISRGRAKIDDNKISFSAVSREGAVSYRGEIENGYIHLKSYSHINKHRGQDSYTFLKW